MELNLDLNHQKISELLQVLLVKDVHRFNEVAKELDWSKTTVSKYLKELKQEEYLKKDITANEKVGYFTTEKGQSLDIFLSYHDGTGFDEHFEDRKELIRDFDDLGFFEKGVNQEECLKLLKKHYNKLDVLGQRRVDNSGEFNLGLYRVLTQLMNDYVFSDKLNSQAMKFNIKVDSDIDEFLAEVDNEKKWIEDEIGDDLD